MINTNIQTTGNNKTVPSNFAELRSVLGKPSNVIQCIPPETGVLTFRMLKWNEQTDPNCPTLIVTHRIIEDVWEVDFWGHDWTDKNNMFINLKGLSLEDLNNWILENAEFIIEKMKHAA